MLVTKVLEVQGKEAIRTVAFQTFSHTQSHRPDTLRLQGNGRLGCFVPNICHKLWGLPILSEYFEHGW